MADDDHLYNSGIKTLPIIARSLETGYWIEVHPDYAAQQNLQEGQPVRISSHHGTVIAQVSLNQHVAPEFPFLDFVPGEANRLTDALEVDRFTNQSLIKRTPIRLEPLSWQEAVLWHEPDKATFCAVIDIIFEHYRAVYPTDEGGTHRNAAGVE
jgi:predicted molibdopterin-dependent oxidoreductase YjgC